MNTFINLRTRTKLFLGFGMIILFLSAVIVTAYQSITAISESQQKLFEKEYTFALNLVEIRADINRQRGRVLEMLLGAKASDLEALKQDIKERAITIDEELQVALDLAKDDARLTGGLKELESAIAEYRKTREQQFALIDEGKIEEARILGIEVQDERYEKTRQLALELGQAAQKSAQDAVTASTKRADRSVRIFLTLGGIALLVALAMSVFLNRIISRPLEEITALADRIASGDLTASDISDARGDEVGLLMQTFNRMTRALQGLAGVAKQVSEGDLRAEVKAQSERDVLGSALSAMTGNLRDVVGEIIEAVNVLTTSATEITASTAQLAAGSAETATAVTETTSTVEEVKHTSQVSSERSKLLAESAQNVARVSESGGKSVAEVIQGMNRIRQQMEAIAESIVKLSEQSQAIGEIIAAVDDLAQQSNLLAVNAAIEAAKAGEQGKGFAVVAQEVKILADQSRQATAQVRGILNDIQKATTAAVLATEQGTKAVEAGVIQSTAAGESITVLADSVAEAAQSATQIAATSQQQSVGMDQVAMAMESIKQSCVQTVASTRQTEAAAQNLKDLGQKLKGLLKRFKV